MMIYSTLLRPWSGGGQQGFGDEKGDVSCRRLAVTVSVSGPLRKGGCQHLTVPSGDENGSSVRPPHAHGASVDITRVSTRLRVATLTPSAGAECLHVSIPPSQWSCATAMRRCHHSVPYGWVRAGISIFQTPDVAHCSTGRLLRRRMGREACAWTEPLARLSLPGQCTAPLADCCNGPAH